MGAKLCSTGALDTKREVLDTTPRVDVEHPQGLIFTAASFHFTIFYYHRYTDPGLRRVALKFDLLFL